MENYNLPRRCIRNFFRSHKCFVFDRPTSKRNLHRLDDILESELEEDFVEQAARFYDYIMKNSSTKTLTDGIKVTGKMLGHLTSLYVDTIQSGSVPSMENAVLALAETENIGALEDALTRYECDMGGFVHLFPTEIEQEFVYMHMQCEKQATDVFLERSFFDTDLRYLQELKTQIKKKKADFMKINEDLSIDLCTNLLKNLSLSMQEGLVQGRYTRPGGHRLYMRDKQQFLEIYDRTPGKGVKALEMLENFICENESIEAAILHTAEKVARAEEQKAVNQERATRATRQRDCAEQQTRALQRALDQQGAGHQQQLNHLTDMMEQNRRRTIQDNESQINRRLQEHQSQLSSSQQQSVNDLLRTIEELERNNQQRPSSGGGGGCILC